MAGMHAVPDFKHVRPKIKAFFIVKKDFKVEHSAETFASENQIEEINLSSYCQIRASHDLVGWI